MLSRPVARRDLRLLVTPVTYCGSTQAQIKSMNITPQTTVGDIAAAFPLSTRIFEDLGIDYCCGGKQALESACAGKGLDPAAVIDRIQQPKPTPEASADWQSMPLNLLIDHILSAHHAYMKAQLPRLSAMLNKILAIHSERHGAVLLPLAGTFRAMRTELDSHLLKEEMVLFPLIRRLESAGGEAPNFHCGSLRNPIRVMTMEHDSAGDALARMRELTGGYTPPAGACETFRAFYAELADMERNLHQHIHLENNILFPRAVELETVAS